MCIQINLFAATVMLLQICYTKQINNKIWQLVIQPFSYSSCTVLLYTMTLFLALPRWLWFWPAVCVCTLVVPLFCELSRNSADIYKKRHMYIVWSLMCKKR